MSIVLLHLLRRLAKAADGSDKASTLRNIFLRLDFFLYRLHIENSVVLCDAPSFVRTTMRELTMFMDFSPREGDCRVDDAVFMLELDYGERSRLFLLSLRYHRMVRHHCSKLQDQSMI
jgi:hypothetical protein